MNISNLKSDTRLTTLMALTTVVALTALLAACGGGGSGTAVQPVQEDAESVPAAASGGMTAFAGWLKQISTESLDGKESLNTGTFTPTVQDDVEPVAAPF